MLLLIIGLGLAVLALSGANSADGAPDDGGAPDDIGQPSNDIPVEGSSAPPTPGISTREAIAHESTARVLREIGQDAGPTASIVAPRAPVDPEVATRLAPKVAMMVGAYLGHYPRETVAAFSQAAGIRLGNGEPKTVYDGQVRGALVFYGVPDPPAAIHEPAETIAYAVEYE